LPVDIGFKDLGIEPIGGRKGEETAVISREESEESAVRIL
jgi:hypothetical protein